MPKEKKPEIKFYYRGPIEVGVGNSYAWRDGYSENSPEGHVQYPWMTARTCQKIARDKGAKAVLIRGSETI